MFALPVSMPRSKSIIFHQNSPKIKLFLQKKMQNFRALGAELPDPCASGGWGFRVQTPNGQRRLGLHAQTSKAGLLLRFSGYTLG